MNFESLKEKLRDQFLELWNRVQENQIFMNLREKYEALSSRTQRAIVAAAACLAMLFLLSFPYAYISSSQESLAAFEENRGLIRGLLKASKSLSEPSPLPPEIPVSSLTSEVSRALEEFHLVIDPGGGIQPLNEKATTLVPDGVKQVAVSLQLKKLNLRQIVEISHRLQTINAGIKLMGMDVRENSTSHYFDVTFKIADFSVPQPKTEDDGGKGKGRSPPSRKQQEEKDKDASETDS